VPIHNVIQENGCSSSLTEQRHILIVDDEKQILESLRDLLEDRFEVHTTTDGREALQMLADFPISVLVTDQRMPGLEGDEILARAAEYGHFSVPLFLCFSVPLLSQFSKLRQHCP